MNTAVRNPRVLVVEDDAKIAALLTDYLRSYGYEPDHVADGLAAVARVRETAPAVVLLDLMLAGIDGIEVCKAVRRFSSVPIMMLTARVDEVDRLIGLEIGADDYVCKPFFPREVVARVKALLRRSERPVDGQPAEAALRLDEAAQRFYFGRRPLGLTPLEFRLLRLLMSHPGRVFSRDQLLAALHDDLRDVSDRAIDSHVKNLRRKLESETGSGESIQSVYGVGYRYEAVDSGAA